MTPSESSMADFDFGFGSATKSGRQSTTPTLGNYPSEPNGQASKAAAKKKQPYREDGDESSEPLISL